MARNRNRRIVRAEDEANRISNAIRRRQRVPRMISLGGVTRLTGSEMLANVSTSSTFNLLAVALQPLLPSSSGVVGLNGSWLGRAASLFNKFKYRRVCLRYVPYCPTSTSGRITIASSTDVADTAPGNAQQLSQYQSSVEAPIWRETCSNFLITRTPEYLVSSDPESNQLVYPGQFLVGTDNGASSTASNTGALYLDYEVDFWSRAAFQDNE